MQFGDACIAGAGGGATQVGSGTMSAALDGTTGSIGYANSGFAATLGTAAFGSTTGGTTSIGTVAAMFSNGGSALLVLSGATAVPTSITIGGVSYPLSFSASSGGFTHYDIVGRGAFTNGLPYTWELFS